MCFINIHVQPHVQLTMDLKTNMEYKIAESGQFSGLKYSMFSPVDRWPESHKISASKLRCGTHFISKEISGDDERKFYHSTTKASRIQTSSGNYQSAGRPFTFFSIDFISSRYMSCLTWVITL